MHFQAMMDNRGYTTLNTATANGITRYPVAVVDHKLLLPLDIAESRMHLVIGGERKLG